jgi:hypothetical protein
LKKYILLSFLLLLAGAAFSQNFFRGIVIDSASFEELPNVMISAKTSKARAISSAEGVFAIQTNEIDTLVFMILGYKPLELPLFFEKDAVLVRMREMVRFLNEVTVRATRLYPNEIVNRTKAAPKKMTAIEGVLAPFDYFWKLEREKRKLSRIVMENNKTQTYVQVINDTIVKDILMKAYGMKELLYYETMAAFNQQNPSVSYSTDPEEIMESLHSFFKDHSNGQVAELKPIGESKTKKRSASKKE